MSVGFRLGRGMWPSRGRGCGMLAALLACGLSATAAQARTPASVIVKLRADGPYALGACAEALSLRGDPFAPALADGSDSLDRLRRALRVQRIRAVFRRPDGRRFGEQRRRLSTRLREALARRRGPRGASTELPELSHVYRMELPADVAPGEAVARLRADPHVEYAQRNHAVELDWLDDPFLASEGSWGQSYADLWGLRAIGAPQAWQQSLGEGVVVAVVDTGVDLEHPDLAPNVWRNRAEKRNGIDDDGNGYIDDRHGYDFEADDPDPSDENGHGSHVAGIAAARGGNGIGIAGVAPRATVLPVRVLPAEGSGDTDRVWAGVLYAALNGADIINASFSCRGVCRSNPIAEEVMAMVSTLGVVFVTSAGNISSDVMLKSPERLRESIVVGATQPSGELASFSSFGLLVDAVAPGVEILSAAARVAPDFYARSRFAGEDYMRLSGTSMAAPHVAGLLALLKSRDPSRSPEQLRALLRSSALDLGEPGHDARFGAGLARAAAALEGPEPPDVRAALERPLPGDTLTTGAGAGQRTPVVTAVAGGDVVSQRLEIAPARAGPAGSAVPLPLLDWRELPTRAKGERRRLAELPLAGLPDGAYLLRLSVETGAGPALQEFAPIAIDRDLPVLISESEVEAQQPDIYAGRVVWSAPGPSKPGSEPREVAPDDALWQGRFGREGQTLLVDGPGHQADVAVSGGGVAWLDRERPGFAGLEASLGGCRGRAACKPRELLATPATRGRPSLSGRRLVVRDDASGGTQLQLCQLGRNPRCESPLLAPEILSPRSPLLDGATLAFRGVGRGLLQLFFCRLGADGRCAARALATPVVGPTLHALSRGLLAYSDLSPDFGIELFVCAIDALDASCDPIRVTRFADRVAPSVDLSDGRLVWHDRGAHGELDIFLCEVDLAAGRCPIQSVTEDAARQAEPGIHRHQLVFEDQREGANRIASLALPALLPLRDHRVQVGERLALPVVARAGAVSRGAVTFSLRGSEGARLVARAGERALLRWRPSADQRGIHRFTLRASLASGLYTERSLAIEVVGGMAPASGLVHQRSHPPRHVGVGVGAQRQ